MADTKITALTAITTVDPAADVLPIVDVSDTSMAASGTTKKITSNQILGAGGTATLASATITGDLTVDTSTLKVNSSLNRVGIQNASPSTILHVGSGSGGNDLGILLSRGATSNFFEAYDGTKSFIAGTDSGQTAVKVGSLSNHSMFLVCNNTTQLQIDPLGVFTFTDGAGGTRMTLNSTGLGVGVVPSAARLEVGGQDGTQFYIRSTGTTPSKIRGFTNAAEAGVIGFLNGGGIYFDISGERMRIDSSGNVGIGVTPSAWGAGIKAIDISTCGLAGAGIQLELASNSVFTSSWVYKGTGFASRYTQNVGGAGVHGWFTAPSGTAGNAITFTQAMTLDASGNLLVACTASPTGTTPGFYFDATHYAYFSRSAGETLNLNRYTSTGATAKFRYSGTEVGDISVTGAGTTYNSTSDYRLKEAVQPLSGGLARVSALKPSIYKWKTDGSNGEGFLAHELAEVVPFAVTGEKDAVNEDGSIKAQSVDMSRVVPILVAAIQELTARVQTIETR